MEHIKWHICLPTYRKYWNTDLRVNLIIFRKFKPLDATLEGNSPRSIWQMMGQVWPPWIHGQNLGDSSCWRFQQSYWRMSLVVVMYPDIRVSATVSPSDWVKRILPHFLSAGVQF